MGFKDTYQEKSKSQRRISIDKHQRDLGRGDGLLMVDHDNSRRTTAANLAFDASNNTAAAGGASSNAGAAQ